MYISFCIGCRSSWHQSSSQLNVWRTAVHPITLQCLIYIIRHNVPAQGHVYHIYDNLLLEQNVCHIMGMLKVWISCSLMISWQQCPAWKIQDFTSLPTCVKLPDFGLLEMPEMLFCYTTLSLKWVVILK